jgi:type I restriction enzyme, S subunit
VSKLPPGWVRAPLATVADVQLGRQRSPKNHIGPNMRPYLRAANVTWNGFALDDVKEMHFSPSEVATFRLAPGDILLSEASGSASEVGKSAMWRGEINDCCFQNTLLRVRTRYLESAYLLWFFKWLALSGQFARGSRGVGIHHLGAKALSEWNVPVASLPEQRRIVAAIEEQFSRLDAGVAALERAGQNLKRMRAALLQAAVTGQLVPHSDEDVAGILDYISIERHGAWRAATNKPYREPANPKAFPLAIPEHWRIASLEAITDPIRVICYGILMPKEHIKDGVPYVRVKDMKSWTIDVAGLKRTSPEIAAKYARASLRAGDLLLAIRGSYGRVAIIPPTLNGGNITQDSARIAPHPTIDRRYLLYYLGGSVANNYYARVARGVAVKGVNIGDLRSMPIPIPPRREQEAIADEIERQFTLLNSAEAAVRMQHRHSQSLRSSILAAAFSGRLVPQDPADEPASDLVARIAEERASFNGHRRARTRNMQVLPAEART